MSGISGVATVVLLPLVPHLLHYLFASTTAHHTTALLPAMLTHRPIHPGYEHAGLQRLMVTLVSGVMGILAPLLRYRPQPDFYHGSGYIRRPKTTGVLVRFRRHLPGCPPRLITSDVQRRIPDS